MGILSHVSSEKKLLTKERARTFLRIQQYQRHPMTRFGSEHYVD